MDIMIRFEFNELKTTQIAAFFLQKNGGSMNYMKLIKLLYLSDRKSLAKWDRPMTCDSYVAMERGPVLSRVLDIINSGKEPDKKSYWYDFISEPRDYSVSLIEESNQDELSKRELELLNAIFERYKECDQWKMVEICHKLPEWEHPGKTSIPIQVEDILRVLDKTDRDIEVIEEEIANIKYMDSILSSAII